MDYSTYDSQLQAAFEPSTGEVITLQDERFPWVERKAKTMRLTGLYEDAGFPELAHKTAVCATWLQYGVLADGTRKLQAGNFCNLRLCPMCIGRRAKRTAFKLSRVLDVVESGQGAVFLFLTLTIRNVSGAELGSSLGQLTAGWNKLTKHRQFERSIGGWFRAIEITRKTKGYHPHIHAILAVEPEYFARGSELYISHGQWLRRWQKALGVEYEPSVRIQVAKAKGEVNGGRAAALEAAKYTVKDQDYIDPRLGPRKAAVIVRDYTNALHRRRLTAYGGWLKDAARELDADDLEGGDLVHIEEEGLREDVAELIETYKWNFGAGDYILSRVQPNPLRAEVTGHA